MHLLLFNLQTQLPNKCSVQCKGQLTIFVHPQYKKVRLKVLPGYRDPWFFADYSLKVIFKRKIITEMNLDIDRVMRFIFLTEI